MQAPDQSLSLLPQDEGLKIRYAFQSGTAGTYSPNYLVKSGAVNYFPLRGGIFSRREKVKYIVVHSTETGVPQDARRVINSWSSGGLRHPGAQYIVDRDGTIFCSVDPTFATVHVNIFKTLPGINNDNSVGIEMCHTGSQTYTPEQRAAVIRLVTYLQAHYHVLNDNVITHRYAQQGDHTDPVNFDWEGFLASKDDFRDKALAMSHGEEPQIEEEATIDRDTPPAAIYLEIHPAIKLEEASAKHVATIGELQNQLRTVQHTYAQTPLSTSTAPGNAPTVAAPAAIATPTVSANRPLSGALPLRGAIELPPDTATEYGAR